MPVENGVITTKINIQSWVYSHSSPTLHSVQYRVLEEERQELQTISNVIDYFNFLEIQKQWYGTINGIKSNHVGKPCLVLQKT